MKELNLLIDGKLHIQEDWGWWNIFINDDYVGQVGEDLYNSLKKFDGKLVNFYIEEKK